MGNRLVDLDSGGAANNPPQNIGEVNDIHTYPYPTDPKPSKSMYAMVGEFGGIGAFIPGHEWLPGKCFTYLPKPTSKDEADTYIVMAGQLLGFRPDVSASVYTQTTDLELECDGFLNYDRTNKFDDLQTRAIHDANRAIINRSRHVGETPTQPTPHPAAHETGQVEHLVV